MTSDQEFESLPEITGAEWAEASVQLAPEFFDDEAWEEGGELE
jgi:hypothetical protein